MAKLSFQHHYSSLQCHIFIYLFFLVEKFTSYQQYVCLQHIQVFNMIFLN